MPDWRARWPSNADNPVGLKARCRNVFVAWFRSAAPFAALDDRREIDAFAAELIDGFG
jgi:hypothetical protein